MVSSIIINHSGPYASICRYMAMTSQNGFQETVRTKLGGLVILCTSDYGNLTMRVNFSCYELNVTVHVRLLVIQSWGIYMYGHFADCRSSGLVHFAIPP